MFIVNGNEYVKTNQYGIARLSQNFSVGTYEIEIFNPLTGQNITKQLKIVSRITGNTNINMDYATGQYLRYVFLQITVMLPVQGRM